MVDLEALVDQLRRSRSDTTNVEAKSAAGGLPASLRSTMSALANLPGGGVVVLGLDESRGFQPVRLNDINSLKSSLASLARQAFVPPISIHISEAEFEGRTLVIGQVDETPPSAKPCRLKQGGQAYLRFWDGDYQLSELEVQGFYVNRTQPRFDDEPVRGTSVHDLDADLVGQFIASIRDGDERFRRLTDDRLVLIKSGVMTAGDVPTLAGLLALGDHPQQWFPNFVIQAAASPVDSDLDDVRVGDRARFSGPIPAMLDQAIAWTRKHSRRRVREDSETGRVRDSLDIPALAARELLANALVHRDLAEWSWSRAVELRIDHDQFRLTNPGGLFGVSTDRLGQQQLSSARNAHLLRICQFIGLNDGNAVEALATGIPKVLRSVADAGLRPPVFFDQALSFTAVIHRTGMATPAPSSPRPRLGRTQPTPALDRLEATLSGRTMTTQELVAESGVTPDRVRKMLRELVDSGRVERVGGPGKRGTVYRLR